MDTHENPDNFFSIQEESANKLFDESSRAFELISNGEEAKAKKEFPLEYFFIKKYVTSGLNELKELLRIRLELH